MADPLVYTFKQVEPGEYDLRTGYKELGRVLLGDGRNFDELERQLYDWTHTGELVKPSGEILYADVPSGSLIRIDRPSLIVYQYQAWPTVIAGSDMAKAKELHFFK
jgi:hypothetical protein